MTTSVAPKQHSSLGASNAYRWMNCPGSVQFTESLPKPPSSIHAEEGTRAHALAEICLRQAIEPWVLIGAQVEGGVVTREMADAVSVYLGVCDDLRIRGGVICRIEHKFDLSPLGPPIPMFGTADFVSYNPTTKTLHVVDLKYGQGVVVEARENPQLQYYAVGASISKDFIALPIEHVSLTIVQPRAGHPDGPVRTWTISYGDLAAFTSKLLDAAYRTQEHNAPLIAGKQCRWCPAAAICPAQREHALQVAQSEFSVVDPKPFTPPAPETIPDAEFAAMMAQLHILEDWASAMRERAQQKLEAGEEVPGFKLVEKRAVRKWTDEAEVARALRADGYESNEILVEPQLKSVAQIEKLLGKKAFAASPVAALVKKESSGLRLAPDSDPAPAAALPGGSEFKLLPGSIEGPEAD